MSLSFLVAFTLLSVICAYEEKSDCEFLGREGVTSCARVAGLVFLSEVHFSFFVLA